MNALSAPTELRERAQWLVWKYEQVPGENKPRKIPYYVSGARRNGTQGSDRDRARLAAFDRALEAQTKAKRDGPGFAFLQGDGLIGIDLDNVIDEGGNLKPWAQELVESCCSYTEYSPSRRGLHIIVRGRCLTFKSDEIGLEVFCGSQYFTYTGDRYPGTPDRVNDIAPAVLERMRSLVRAAKKRPQKVTQVAPITPDRARVESALAYISADCGYDEWLRIGMGVHAELGDAGFDVWERWSARSAKYPGSKELETKWRSFSPGGGVTGATLFALAIEAGWRAPSLNPGPGRQAKPDAIVASGGQSAAVYTLTEDNLARAFADQHKDALRHSHDSGRWHVWNGTRWREDTTDIAFEWSRRLCRELNIEGKKAFAKAAVAAAVERFARADRTFAMRGDEWNADPWLLGTPAGTVDLRVGEVLRASPADLITRSTLVAPAEGEPRLWRQFLAQATCEDEEMELFLRQIAGYALTGDTRHECLFFFYGAGGSGKGTFVGALHEILGEYSAPAAMDTFLDTRYERHSTDLAMLRSARMVIASETKKGRAWDEQRVKALTGGDPITARFMRMDNFTYRPAFKLVLIGNHKPVLKSVDDAWRRRFHIIPFSYRPRERDETLKARLREEYPQILRWAIDGCLDWQRNGLIVPERVKAETASYFTSQDQFSTWLEEYCERDRGHVEKNAALFASWKAYCEASGERPGSAKLLHEELSQAGFRPIKDAAGIRGRGFMGLRVKP